ncbi:regulator of G-protein signaling 9a isoform X3 [Hoplias malabaricus]|uniref:regulator of G-protein signaling 9a isoform X3 n=1 Tax=Hoplias malabaricus TaxID=27720 RepID=UPI0034620CA0
MTIKLIRDHGQHYRPRMACLNKLELMVLEMQNPKSGVKSSEQKLNVTSIPHVIAGQDILAWIADHIKVDTQEARAVGTMLVAYGFIYPLQDHKKLILKPDASLYRFQTPYFWPVQKRKADDTGYAIYLAKRNIRKKGTLDGYEQEYYDKLHKWLNHKWDFIVMQAKEQYRVGKERSKSDRVVFDCQERAYWIVHRPPPQTHSAMDYGVDRLIDPNAEEEKTFDYYRRIVIFTQQAIMRPKVKSTVSLGAIVKYMTTYKDHDPFLAPCLPSNPWQTDDDTFWELNMRNVETPTKMRVERWSFSFFELLSDPRGRTDFKVFLKKEFSGENLAFWEAAEEMKWGAASSISEKSQTIFKTFLAPGAPRWINIDGRTMGLTVKGLDHPHRYVLDAAQTHIFMLMKKDTFYRYLKSPVYKDIQKKAISPAPHKFTDSQLEQNARNRKPGIHPIVIWNQEEEERAKAAAAAGPIDIKKLMASKLDRK